MRECWSAASSLSVRAACSVARADSSFLRAAAMEAIWAARVAINIWCFCSAAARVRRASASTSVANSSSLSTAWPSSTCTISTTPSMSAVALIGSGSGSIQPLAWNSRWPAAAATGAALTAVGSGEVAITKATSTSGAGSKRSRKSARKRTANPAAMASGMAHAGTRRAEGTAAAGRERESSEGTGFMGIGNFGDGKALTRACDTTPPDERDHEGLLASALKVSKLPTPLDAPPERSGPGSVPAARKPCGRVRFSTAPKWGVHR